MGEHAVWVVMVAAVTSCAVVGAVLPTMSRRAIDVPTARSSHTAPTPRGGGVGVVVGLGFGCAVGAVIGEAIGWWLVLFAAVLGAIGLMEDLVGLSIRIRFLMQAAASLGVSAALMLPERHPVLVLLATASLVVLINGYNFMDGINGISSLSAVIAATWYAYLSGVAEVEGLAIVALALAGAAAGFLPWNLIRARIFLGDCGSYALGGGVGALAVAVWLEGASLVATMGPLVIYLGDVGWTLARRVARGERWYEAHRQHVYQRLADAAGHMAVSLGIAGASAGLCLAAAVLDGRPVGWLLAVYVVVVGAYLSAGTHLGQVSRSSR